MIFRNVWQGGATEEGRIQEKLPKHWKEPYYFYFFKYGTLLCFLLEVTPGKYLLLYKRTITFVKAMTTSADTVLTITNMLNGSLLTSSKGAAYLLFRSPLWTLEGGKVLQNESIPS